MFLPLLGAPAPTQQETLNLITEKKPAIVQVVEPTLEEKIRTNYYKCKEDIEWIRADNATCLPKQQQTTTTARKAVKSPVSGSNTYTPGQCTWHTKNVLGWVPNGLGDATNWAANARAQGFTLSSVPKVGAIAWRYGHVAAVVGVGDGTVVVSEMNYDWVPYHQRTIEVSVDNYQYIY